MYTEMPYWNHLGTKSIKTMPTADVILLILYYDADNRRKG